MPKNTKPAAAPAQPAAPANPGHIEVRKDDKVIYAQVETSTENSRKLINEFLDTPAGTGCDVTIVSNGRTIQFAVDKVEVLDVVRVYNGIRFRK